MEAYFDKLTPRQQLNDLIHKVAQAGTGDYPSAWNKFDKRWKKVHGTHLSWLRWEHNIRNHVNLTLPAYLEASGKLGPAITIAMKMKEEANERKEAQTVEPSLARRKSG
jgi:hypothetical protein